MFRSAPAPPIFSRHPFLAAAILATYFLLPSAVTAQLLCPPTPPPGINGEEVNICAVRQEKDGQIFKLHVRSRISYRDLILWADEATYDSNTGDADVEGHVVLDGGPNDDHIKSSHGSYNLTTETGRFYDVTGSTGLQFQQNRVVLSSSAPFTFTGPVSPLMRMAINRLSPCSTYSEPTSGG